MKIGVHMIVRNCAEELERSLNSIEGLYDFLSICDTGSNDKGKTVKVAEKYNAIISYYKSREGWNHPFIDDFGSARNTALDALPKDCDWIFFLDSDDVIPDPINLRQAILTFDPNKKQVVSVMYDYGGGLEYMLERFWSKGTTRWRGRIHECKDLGDPETKRVTLFGFRVVHHQHPERAHTFRNLTILEDTIKTDKDSRYLFYLAKEYTYSQRWEEAIAWFLYYLGNPMQIEFETHRALYELAHCYFKLKQFEKAKEYIFKTIENCDEYAEPFVLMSKIYMTQLQWDKAIPWLKHALSLPEPSRGWFNYKAFTTYLPNEFLSMCLFYTGELEEAKIHHFKAREQNPDLSWIAKNDKWYLETIEQAVV